MPLGALMSTLSFLLALLFSYSIIAEELSFPAVFPEFAKLSLDASVKKKDSKKFADLSNDQDRYYLSVPIGKISQTQFNSLNAFYGSQSKVTYDGSRNYDLSDFLPASIQTVINKTFSPFFITPRACIPKNTKNVLDLFSPL
jgi:hypothetical protein